MITHISMIYLVNVAIIVFGGIIGSFLNVCIYRLPRNKSIVIPSSFCPSCEKPIKFYDNIPILSYLLLKGKCRQCSAYIPIKYPIVEFITAFLFFMLLRKYGLSFELFVNMLFFTLLIVVSFIDLDFKIIPDVLSIGGLIAGLIMAFFRRPSFFYPDAIYGIFIGGGILFVIAYGYQLLRKREGMGGGDIKLLGMIGAFCGIKGVIFSLMSGSLLGTMIGIPMMLIKGEDAKYAIPFGPFLSIGAIIFIFFGDRIIYGFLNIVAGR
jgi:leader peptidase (prepilin peptidase) / N-methyltransferase